MTKERDVRMKNGLKTTRKEMSRRCQRKHNFHRGLKKKRCPKIPGCQEKEMSTVNGKKLKRHPFQETAMTSEKTCQERRVLQVSGFRAGDKKGCQDSDMSGASRIKRKWHQTKMSRARNVKDKDFQEITQSTPVPARGSGAVPMGSPLSL